MKAVGYVRVSTTEQANEGQGLDIQRDAVAAWCKEQDHELVRVCCDAGVSGSNGLDSRVGLAEALALVESGAVSLLVVARLDRLARDLLVQETVIARVSAVGGKVCSVAEPDVASEDPTRVLVRQVLGAIAQYERALIRGRMAAGRRRKLADGGYGGGTTRYGTRLSDGERVEDSDEQAAIALARELQGQGMALRQIAAELSLAGHAPRRASAWHPTTVARLLR